VRIRFLADADLKFQIVVAVRQLEPTIDFMSANKAGLVGIKDPQVLLYAARQGRMLVTHDRDTMPRHFYSFIKSHQSPGIIVVPQSFRISAAANDLVLMWAVSKQEEWANQIVWVPV
jgi:predicted nuclease of predicted toxin-antitoxin system